MPAAMELTVIIPTRNRRAILCETLDRLEAQLPEVQFEAIVVDDGSTDDTIEVLERRAAASAFPLIVMEQPGLGPATARNRAMAGAHAPICLFIDDDTWPLPGLLARHRDFHVRRPEPEAALLGFVGIAVEPTPTPFMRWLASLHLGFDRIEDPDDVGGGHFFSGNVSVKTAFVRAAGGFDEGFKSASYEDIDLGHRLEKTGMRLVYDRGAAVEHYHPTDLKASIARMRNVGAARAQFVERHPEGEVVRRPGPRHRVKAAALTVFAALGARTRTIQHQTWQFLCHEATREGYWDALDEKAGRRVTGSDHLRIGATLARYAARDQDAQMPRERLGAAGMVATREV